MRHLRLGFVVVVTIALWSCARNSPTGPPQPSAYDRLQSIPAADTTKFEHLRDFKSWQNPYLLIHTDGVSLLDFSNNEEHALKMQELPDALARLSPSAWPYGRVVAVAEDKATSADNDVLIRKNRGIVAGTLETLHVVVNWVPSS
jgi:hypothetical protein